MIRILRHYPPRFAKLMVQLLDTASYLTREMVDAPQARTWGLYNTLKAKPLEPWVASPDPSLPLLRLQGTFWNFSRICAGPRKMPGKHLTECMFYLRRSKLVDVPRPFKEIIPASEFELQQMVRAQ